MSIERCANLAKILAAFRHRHENINEEMQRARRTIPRPTRYCGRGKSVGHLVRSRRVIARYSGLPPFPVRRLGPSFLSVGHIAVVFLVHLK